MAQIVGTTLCEIDSQISPKMIFLNTDGPAFMVMGDTLGRTEWEVVAANIVYASKEAGGNWMKILLSEKCDYSDMVTEGLVVEEMIEGKGWAYSLTRKAVERIYIAQAERTRTTLKYYQEELDRMNNIKPHIPWWKRLFSTSIAITN
jgi:hypothetical protein